MAIPVGIIDDILRLGAKSSVYADDVAIRLAAKGAGYTDEAIDAALAASKSLVKTGSISSTLGTFALTHPYLTVAGVGLAGVTAVAAIGATKGVVSDFGKILAGSGTTTNIYGSNVKAGDPTVDLTKQQDKPKVEDTGLLGWFTDNFMTGLFGTQVKGVDFMTKAKPWLIGGAVVVGIVAVGYTVKALKK